MGFGLDARKRNGRTQFRIWSTAYDSYLTQPLTEKKVTKLLLDIEIRDARERVARQIAHAKKFGATGHSREPKTLQSPWQRNRPGENPPQIDIPKKRTSHRQPEVR